MWARLSKRRRKVFIITGATLILLIFFFIVFVNSFLKPILRDRLHTLIVQGSDSLYSYTLTDLEPNFFGSSVVVENLQLRIDSNRYRQLVLQNRLPTLSFELNLVKGSITGIGIFQLLVSKRLIISEIKTTDATITLLRHTVPGNTLESDPPLWKTIQPTIKSIRIRKVSFDNLKLAYKNTDTSAAVRFRFEKCFASLDDFRIDSTSATDTSRIFFAKEVALEFRKLDFVTADSVYRVQAGSIDYASRSQKLEVGSFLMKPLLPPADFYRHKQHQQNMNEIAFAKMSVSGFSLQQFVNHDRLNAEELVVQQPRFNIYLDKTFPPAPESKIGKSPQQQLLSNSYEVMIHKARLAGASIVYTEKNEKTQREGTVTLDDLDLRLMNITNDTVRIKKNPVCSVTANGKILGSSPIKAEFAFRLDSLEGRFDAKGSIGPVTAAQLNKLSEPLASVHLNSFNMQGMEFSLYGDQLTATCNLSMRYHQLSVLFQKVDEASGAVETKKLITKILNKYTLYPSNPDAAGMERKAAGIERTRTSAQSFAALIWQTIFAAMQDIMMKKA